MNLGIDDHPELAPPTSGEAQRPARPADAGVAILLVEDNPGDARLVEEHLGAGLGMHHEVVHVKRLAEANDWLDAHHADLVLLDLTLPDSRGLDTLQRVQAHAFGVPVVVLTGVADDQLAFQAIQSGAQDYLQKDAIDPVRLSRTVRYAIERKQWEDSVRLNDERLQRLEKVDAVARLSEGIAHNFNNILTAIIGNCELLLGRLGHDEKALRHAENIQQAAREAAELTRELKEFVRHRKPQPQRLDLVQFVKGLEPLLRGVFAQRMRLAFELPDAQVWALADPGELEQVLLNLVQNAQEALAGGGGSVTVRVHTADLAETLERRPDRVPAGSYSVIEVSDDGPGIDPSVMPHIFDTFFTTKGEKRPGLGLSTALSLVRRSHAFIVADAIAGGGGARFAIWLPRMADQAAPPAGAPVRAPRGLETVLLVEDDPQIAAVIAETLSAHGYRMFVASSGEEALEQFRQHPNGMGVVVSDVDMTGISGYELAQRLVALQPATRIILISGHDSPMPASQDLIAAYLPKPFSPIALAKTIREVATGLRRQHA